MVTRQYAKLTSKLIMALTFLKDSGPVNLDYSLIGVLVLFAIAHGDVALRLSIN